MTGHTKVKSPPTSKVKFDYLLRKSMAQGLRLPSHGDEIQNAIVSKPIIGGMGGAEIQAVVRRSGGMLIGKEERLRYIENGRTSIMQGSHTVSIPLFLLWSLSSMQRELGLKGSIGEIGVHGGLFFIGLAHMAAQDESLWACDVFDDQEKNIDGSGYGNYDYFLQKCKEFGISQSQIHIFRGSSAELDINFSEMEGISKFRIFSVDGGHTRQLTFNDLTIAASNLIEGGIIVLDDVTNLQWPGVIDGFLSWLVLFPEDFAPFFVGHNKVFLCHAAFHGRYYNFIKGHSFWSNHVSDNPSSNKNVHKAPKSGFNHFSWGGYQYLQLIEPIDDNVVTSQWKSEIEMQD